LYTYQPDFDKHREEINDSWPAPARRSSPSAATTAYTSSGAATGLPLSAAARNGYGNNYVSSSLIEPHSSVITPVNSRIEPVDSVIQARNSVIEPINSRIEPGPSVIHHSSDNKTCADVVIPTCSNGSVLVYFEPDSNGCNLSPLCSQ
ncbi:MAG: hypothetical protein K2Q32_01600, partial [Alphaproteobacteria bacterium]|nr:hypothetical protein [Alphaproteobacteria bacterium]